MQKNLNKQQYQQDLTNVMSGDVFAQGVLLNATPVVVPMIACPLPATVWARPLAGDSVLVEYSTDGGVTYDPWPLGTAGVVTAYTNNSLISAVTHVRFTRSAGTGITSRYGIC